MKDVEAANLTIWMIQLCQVYAVVKQEIDQPFIALGGSHPGRIVAALHKVLPG